ncbi:MAG: gliding motility protein GldM [Bacteroidales bacterium]
MAHGKETPRQKMIGMMYLVLTALLALNVAAEVLNAFSLIDSSLRKTTANTVIKNDKVYTDFESAMQTNKSKTEKWKKIADEVKLKSQELVVYIDTLKYKIVRTVEGPKGDPNNIEKKDDINVPGQIMVTEKENGKNRGTILMEKIIAYKEFLTSKVEDKKKYGELINNFNSALNTDPIIGQEGNKVPWVAANFDQLPMAGVVALMSKMQADIRNAEADMLNYLYSQIDVGSFKFNKLEAVVSSPTNYVLMNQPYKAEVFLAASDTTAVPVIKLDGGTNLPIEGSRGIYTGGTGSPGDKTWGGVIEIKSPATGEILKFPFKSTYTVGQAALVVSPTKMNVFYIGVDNPVDVSVPGVPPGNVIPFITGGGSITRSGNSWVVRVKEVGKVSVGATAKLEGQNKNMGSKEFRVKKVPDPKAMVGGKAGGSVAKNWLVAQTGVSAVLENFDFDLKFQIRSFTVSATAKGGFLEDAKSNGPAFTAQQKQLITNMTPGKKVYIEDVEAVGPDGTVRNLGSITFRVQ